MKKKIVFLAATIAWLILLSGCGCEHAWVEADCDAPRTCSLCGQTEGDVLEHSWADADCESPKTCINCGETEGEALGHSWVDGDCLTPKTCAVCQVTEGEPQGHRFSHWQEADTTMTRSCTVCQMQETEELDWNVLLTDLAQGRWDCVSYLEIEEYPAEQLFPQIPYLEIFEDQTICIFVDGQEYRGTIQYRERILKEDLNLHLFYAVLADKQWLLIYNFPREGIDRPAAITGNLNTVLGLYRFEQK